MPSSAERHRANAQVPTEKSCVVKVFRLQQMKRYFASRPCFVHTILQHWRTAWWNQSFYQKHRKLLTWRMICITISNIKSQEWYYGTACGHHQFAMSSMCHSTQLFLHTYFQSWRPCSHTRLLWNPTRTCCRFRPANTVSWSRIFHNAVSDRWS